MTSRYCVLKYIFLLGTLIGLFVNKGITHKVNGVPLDSITVEYIQIVGTQKPLSTKVFIDIDFGQRNKMWVFKDTQLQDETGKLIELNSMIDALNFMIKYGYEFVQAYAFSDNGSNVYHYLLRKLPK